MGREDQIEEREVLDAIFPDEITDISETEYRISITLDIPDEREDADPAPVMILSVQYPDDYPDKPPHLDLSAPQNAPPHRFFSVAEDKAQLLEGLEPTVQENLGMAMVFTLVSALKESAEQLAVERREAGDRAREEEMLAAEREENKKFHGEPVTPASFARWRNGFLAEIEERKAQEEEERVAELKKKRIKEPVRLTGRQLWERGLVGKVEEEEDAEDGGLEEGVDRLKVSV